MKRVKATVIFAFVFVMASVAGHAQVLPDQTDTQNWNDVFLTVPVTGPFDVILQGTIRNGRDISRPVDERLGLGFSFRIGKYVAVVPNYLYIGMQPFEGRRVFENRLSLLTQVRFPVGRFTIADRNLFERRIRRPINSTRYRNRLQVEHPIGPKDHKLSLFVSDEVFYDWSFNAWVRNRAAIGVSKVVNKHFTLELYYMRQNDSHSLPGDLHVIGTGWRFRL
jgi:Protein of unknown function (DUF2490)